MPTRRDMMWGSASALLLAACQGSPAARETMAEAVSLKRQAGQPRVGIQTYTIREAMEADTGAALRMLAEVGYDFVETNDRDFTRVEMAELKAALAEAGLPVASTHVGFSTIKDEPEAALAAARELGAEYAILPWLPEEYRSTEGYTEMASHFDRVGAMMKAGGVRFGYHNHQFEFWDIDGPRNGMEILLEETDPDLVTFELDMFWAELGRQDVADLFRRYPGRFELCHIKDMERARLADFPADSLDFDGISSGLMVNVGEGDLPFETWLGMADVSGMKLLVTEHDNPPAPYRDSVATMLRTVRGYDL